MKNTLIKILKFVLAPLLYCRRIVMEASVIVSDNNLVGYADFNRYFSSDEADSSCRMEQREVSRNESGWVCHAR